MRADVLELRSRTPVAEALVASILTRTKSAGLEFEDNMRAYDLRMFEARHPWLARAWALVRYGPRIAFARRSKTLGVCNSRTE
jgi:hypothetical protein